MLHCVVNPTRHPARSPSAAVVTTNEGTSIVAISAWKLSVSRAPAFVIDAAPFAARSTPSAARDTSGVAPTEGLDCARGEESFLLRPALPVVPPDVGRS